MATIKLLHIISAALFLIDYLVKTTLLLIGSDALERYKKITKVPSMIISTIFLGTGIYLISQIGMKNIGGWFHLKLTLVIVGIVVGIIGFKKNNKVLAVISTLLFLYIYGISETKDVKFGIGKAKMEGVVTDTADAKYDLLAHGKLIYTNECVRCHGEDGKAMINGATDLTGSMCENRGLIGIIKHGRNLMPAFKQKLNEQEINAVAEYVKSIRVHQEQNDSTATDSL
jgi:uncharacterized membrane protein SirB2